MTIHKYMSMAAVDDNDSSRVLMHFSVCCTCRPGVTSVVTSTDVVTALGGGRGYQPCERKILEDQVVASLMIKRRKNIYLCIESRDASDSGMRIMRRRIVDAKDL